MGAPLGLPTMSESFDDEFSRRLLDLAGSVAGLSEDEAVAALDARLAQTQLAGAVLHRLSLAQARGTLARALGEGADVEVLSSLDELVTTIEATCPAQMPQIGPAKAFAESLGSTAEPELAENVVKLLIRHRENAVAILGLIARASTTQPDPELVTKLEQLLAHDLEALEELENR